MEKEEVKIHLELTLSETNTILEGLSLLPFKDVYKIIEKIHLQSKKANKKDS